MIFGEVVVPLLEKAFKGWYFFSPDMMDLSGGFFPRVNSYFEFKGSFVCAFVCCLENYSNFLDYYLYILNFYGPYEERIYFWEMSFITRIFKFQM